MRVHTQMTADRGPENGDSPRNLSSKERREPPGGWGGTTAQNARERSFDTKAAETGADAADADVNVNVMLADPMALHLAT